MHIKSLDGLRGFAALWVCLFHYGDPAWGLPYGHAAKIGVMIFFVLSGFLMGHLYFSQSPTLPAVGNFFRRRFARIMPLHYLLVLLSFALMMTAAADFWPYQVTEHRLLKNLIYRNGTSVFWTVVVEVQFYTLFPIFWLIRHKLGDKAAWLFAGSLVLYYFLPVQKMHYVYGSWHWFVAGLFIACLPHRTATVWNVGFIASLIGTVLLCPAILGGYDDGMTEGEIGYAMWNNPVHMLTIASLVVCTIRAPLAHTIFGSAPFRFFGTISYSLYLLHLVVLSVFDHYIWPHDLTILPLYLAVTIALSYASYLWIERPARLFLTEPVKRVRTAKAI